MPVSSIYQPDRSGSKASSAMFYFLLILGLVILGYLGFLFVRNITGLSGKSSLTVDVFYNEADVLVNDAIIGKTPVESVDIKSGDNKLTVRGTGVAYEINLNFMPNSEVVVKRDLGISQVFSGGQNFWLEKSEGGSVLNIISEPAGAEVYIDGSKVGVTPYSTAELSAGSYDLRIQSPGYESQTARIEITDGYKLNASSSLFPSPVPESVGLLPDAENLYDIYSDNLVVTSDTSAWAEAVVYWNTTRGINLAGAGVNKEKVFNYFLDYTGMLYNADGLLITGDAVAAADLDNGKVAYLRRLSDGPGLTEAAKQTFLGTGSTPGGGNTVTILETGVGWLRVRSEPSLSGSEVARVNVGESYTVLEEEPGWVKIQVSDTLSGWVSDTYVESAQ